MKETTERKLEELGKYVHESGDHVDALMYDSLVYLARMADMKTSGQLQNNRDLKMLFDVMHLHCLGNDIKIREIMLKEQE
jgi:hypothetical protein